MAETASGGLRQTLNLAQPDDIFSAIVDAHRGLSDEQCRALDAGLILLLANHVGDAGVIREVLAAARRALEGGAT
ncbi:MAG: DUF2783 domain-containing protein [Reyranella sp.]|nr:DUF2783 domain-containing protein [Reyranella sp.]